MLATVNPVNSRATARAAFPGGASSAATADAMPKNAPCASAVAIRAASRKRKSGRDRAGHVTGDEHQHQRSSARRRDTGVSSAATNGDPKATLSA